MPKEASFDNALAFAADLIAIPGLSGKEDEVARRLFQEMEALGLADVRVDDAGHVIGVARGRGYAPAAMRSKASCASYMAGSAKKTSLVATKGRFLA